MIENQMAAPKLGQPFFLVGCELYPSCLTLLLLTPGLRWYNGRHANIDEDYAQTHILAAYTGFIIVWLLKYNDTFGDGNPTGFTANFNFNPRTTDSDPGSGCGSG